ncbi:MAG: hypothetical protein HYS26_04205 [Candidatus Kaiserbacteria bacterium]|nr:MAG: hypothetical protein HYS26_04205 [Candidatus Kaiserbacteria bacterium]
MAILRPNEHLRLPPEAMSLEGAGMATIVVTYPRLDHPKILQTFAWQEIDLYPWFPVMNAFLCDWIVNKDSKPQSARVMHSQMRGWAEFKMVAGVFRLQ